MQGTTTRQACPRHCVSTMAAISCAVGPVASLPAGARSDGLDVVCVQCGRAYALLSTDAVQAAAVVERWLQQEFGHTIPAQPAPLGVPA